MAAVAAERNWKRKLDHQPSHPTLQNMHCMSLPAADLGASAECLVWEVGCGEGAPPGVEPPFGRDTDTHHRQEEGIVMEGCVVPLDSGSLFYLRIDSSES